MYSNVKKRIQEQLRQELPFVVYRKPRQKQIRALLQPTDRLHFLNNFNQSGFVFAPFDSTKKSILFENNDAIIADDFEQLAHSVASTIQEDSSEREMHINLVQRAIDEIKTDKVKKVVLSRKIIAPHKTNALALFERLLTRYEAVFCYLWYHPKVGMWLGATPEILLRTNNLQITSMSLAGTQTYKANEQIEWGTKELEEQAMVTDYMMAALQSKVGQLKASPTETIKAGNLLHLRTTIRGRMQSGLGEIISALHPTPAVCGLPKVAAKKFILAHENYDREFYTGFLGELNLKENKQRNVGTRNQENSVYRSVKTKSELFVNLRCMKLVGDTAHIFVGGGITAASNAAHEWQETVNKSQTMLNILA